MEKEDDLLRLRVYGGEVRAFVQIAVEASKSEVFSIIATTVLARDHMLDMEDKEWVRALVQPTVFTAISSAFAHESSLPRIQALRGLSFREALAGS